MKHIISNEKKIAYKYTDGEGLGVVFIGGHTSIMKGRRRSRVISNFCKENNMPFLEFDYSGYGESEGKYEEWQTDEWIQNILDLIDNVAAEKNILIGHSMGGYLMLLITLLRPERVEGLIGMAPGFGSYIQKKGKSFLSDKDNTASIPLILKEDGGIKRHEIEKPLNITQPVRLLHGFKDDVVRWQSSINIANSIPHDDVEIRLLKASEHSVERKEDTTVVCQFIEEIKGL